MPKVSALLPTYNTNPEHLRETIDSVLAQTFSDFELIILDDCSTEPAVREVIASYSDKRIRFFENETNLGISGSRNRLVELAQGKYLAVIDHDDISMPNRFELQVNFLDEHPEVGVVGGNVTVIPKHELWSMPLENDDIENMMLLDSAVIHPASMLRKSVLDKHGIRYESDYSPAEDYRLWIRILGKTKFANLPDILLHYRAHADNTSSRQVKKMNTRGHMLTSMARIEHPEIWFRAQRYLETKTKYKLFGIFHIMTTREIYKRKEYLLFGFIPLFKCRQSQRFYK